MVEDQDLEKILEAAPWLLLPGNQQLYSIIVIKSQETKDKLSESCDHQPFIAKAPVLLLFVSDQKNGLIITGWRAVSSFLSGSPGFSGKLPMNRI